MGGREEGGGGGREGGRDGGKEMEIELYGLPQSIVLQIFCTYCLLCI